MMNYKGYLIELKLKNGKFIAGRCVEDEETYFVIDASTLYKSNVRKIRKEQVRRIKM